MTDIQLSDGTNRRVFRRGEGSPVFFVPMLAEMNFVFVPQLNEVSKRHHVVLFEPLLQLRQPNHIRDRAAEISQVMDALDTGPVHLVGWSDAGAGAYEFAKRYPDRCRSITLIGLANRYAFPGWVNRLMWLYNRFPLERVIPGFVVAGFIAYYLGGAQLRSRWIWREALKIRELSPVFKFNLLTNLTEHAPEPGDLRCPAVVMWGEGDRLVSRKQALAMAEIVNAEGGLIVVDKGEHFPSLLGSAAVTEHLMGFFAAHTDSSRPAPDGMEDSGQALP